MYNIKEFFAVLNKIAPIDLSLKMIESGSYDNSGIIIFSHEEVKKVLFSLDLSLETVNQAKFCGCDTVVTHHPAIYHPVNNLSINGDTAAVILAAKEGLNVISMHLNLDVAKSGIDFCLAKGLGGKDIEIIELLSDEIGYGRKFEAGKTLGEIEDIAKKNFQTERVIVYGDKKAKVIKAASFCGGGYGDAEKALTAGKLEDTQAVITSDMPHHGIKRFVEAGKNIILLTHYAAENYGFKMFYENIKTSVSHKAETQYFEDKRFM